MIGLEAGQSAFGDVYAWFKNLLSWPLDHLLSDEKTKTEITDKLITSLSNEAAKLDISESDELAVDWLNGRRTPDANQLLTGAIINLDLATDAPRFFKALAEATCFGAKAIVDKFIDQGIPVKGLIGLGGVANKSPYIMQMMADVINMPIRIHKSEQTCAAGAAMFAATAAGIYKKVEDAMQAMGHGFVATYYPDKTKTEIYAKRYLHYRQLGKFIEEKTVKGQW
jgi:L-ribulokinase